MTRSEYRKEAIDLALRLVETVENAPVDEATASTAIELFRTLIGITFSVDPDEASSHERAR